LFLAITPILFIAGIAPILFIPAVAWVLLVPIPVLFFSAVLANYPRHAYQTRRPWSPPHARLWRLLFRATERENRWLCRSIARFQRTLTARVFTIGSLRAFRLPPLKSESGKNSPPFARAFTVNRSKCFHWRCAFRTRSHVGRLVSIPVAIGRVESRICCARSLEFSHREGLLRVGD